VIEEMAGSDPNGFKASPGWKARVAINLYYFDPDRETLFVDSSDSKIQRKIDEQLEQREKLALDLLSRWNYGYAVKQRLVCGRAHSIPHHIDDCCPAGTVRVIGK